MITELNDITSFKWATVTGVNPLAIRLDGDTASLALIPDSLIGTVVLNDRVRVELTQRKVIVHGKNNGGSPVAHPPLEPVPGWGLYFNHPSGVPSGVPSLMVLGAITFVKILFRNETGAAVDITSGVIIAKGLPRSAFPDTFALSVYSTITSAPGPVSTSVGVFVTSDGILYARSAATIAANAFMDIHDSYLSLP